MTNFLETEADTLRIEQKKTPASAVETCGILDFLDGMIDRFDLTPPDSDPAPAAALAAPPASAAADFYVAMNGRDSNPGTIDSPLASITRAVSLAGPGDVISVRGGAYSGQAKIWKGGTEGNPVTIQAQPGEYVILDGRNGPANSDVVAITASYVVFEGFDVRNATRSGISVYAAHDVTVRDNEVQFSHRNGIWVGGWREGQSYDNLVAGNVIHHNALDNAAKTSGGGWARGLAIDVTADSTISDNIVFRNHGEGVGALSSERLTYEGNTVYDNYSAQMYFDNSQYVAATGNRIFHTGAREFYRDGKPGIGVLIANEYAQFQKSSTGYEVTGNTLAGVGAPKYDGSYGWGGGISNSDLSPNQVLSAAAVESDWLFWG